MINNKPILVNCNITNITRVDLGTTKEGSVSFAYGNSVTTWNFINNNKRTIKQYGVHKITSLIEYTHSVEESSSKSLDPKNINFNDSIIVGNKNGNIYLHWNQRQPNKSKSQPIITYNLPKSDLIKIQSLHKRFLIYSTTLQPQVLTNLINNKNIIIYDLNLNSEIYTLLAESNKHISVVNQEDIIEYTDIKLELKAYSSKHNNYQAVISKEFQDGIFKLVSLESGSCVYILHNNKSAITIWNIKDDSMKSIPIDEKLSSEYIKDIKIIDEDSIVITSSNGESNDESNDNHFSIYQISLGMWKHLDDGNHKDIISLSDQSYLISKSLRSGQSSIEILSKENFTSIFKYESPDISKILSLNTNHYGFIFAQFERRLVVFKPDYSSNNHESTTDIISKIKFAIKQCNSYQTRKILDTFIKNVPVASTDDIDINIGKQIYELLKQSPLISEMNRVSLYLFRRTGDHQYIDKDRKCKSRLIVGDGDFSYSTALLDKHMKSHNNLARSLIATELQTLSMESEKTTERLDRLSSKGVKTIIGFNAIDISRLLHGRYNRIKRIHWVCPWPMPLTSHMKAHTSSIIHKFFQSASQVHHENDRIQITLTQEPEKKIIKQFENPIARASLLANYRLIRKRRFSNSRYPGYQHLYTTIKREYLGDYKREFVFEKVNPLDINKKNSNNNNNDNSSSSNHHTDEISIISENLKDISKKNYTLKKDKISNIMKLLDGELDLSVEDYYFDCSTDDDSSDYYDDSDDDEF